MNYTFWRAVKDFVAEETISASQFLERLDFLRGNLHAETCPLLWNLIDSHDTERFLHICGEQKEKLKFAAALQMLLPGMPVIYYGDEYGMTGGPDPDCRRGMVWDEEYQDADIYRWYNTLIRLRKEFPCILQDPERQTDDAHGLIRLTGRQNGQEITVFFHGKGETAALPEFAGRTEELSGQTFGGTMEGYQAAVFLSEQGR